MTGKKILLVQLISFGDCLMVTALARQIKNDFPGCHITWAISYVCKQVIVNNPFVDEIWEIKYSGNESPDAEVWERVKVEAEQRKAKGEFDEIIYSQIYPDNLHRYDGTTRSSTFRAYHGKITVPVSPVVRLLDSEIGNVEKFAELHQLKSYKNVILFECTPSSYQSFVNLEFGLSVSEKLIRNFPELAVIISTHLKINSSEKRIIDGSVLTFRENAELSKYCTLLVGCSSGISWLLSSDRAKRIPSLQILKKGAQRFSFASMKYDFEFWKLPTGHIIETTENRESEIVKIISHCLSDFETAKKVHDEILKPTVKTFRILGELATGKWPFSRLRSSAGNFRKRNKISVWESLEMYWYMYFPQLKLIFKKLLGIHKPNLS